MALIVRKDIPYNTLELDVNTNRENLEYINVKINTKNHSELILCLQYSTNGIVYQQLFETLDHESNNLITMGDFDYNTLILVTRKKITTDQYI